MRDKKRLAGAGILWGLAVLSAVGAAVIPGAASAEEGGRISMSVLATNKTGQKSEKMPVRQDLPPEIDKADVLDPGGLEVRYDEGRSVFYLYTEVDLEADASRTYKVVLKDRWKVPDSDFTFLKEQADQRLEKLKDKDSYEAAKAYRDKLAAQIDALMQRQTESTGDAASRIEFYRTATEKLREIRRKVTLIDDFADDAKNAELPDEKYIRFVIEATNPSDTEPNDDAEIVRYLPEGIRPFQIADSQGFEVRFDVEKNLYYLARTVSFAPGETKKFVVKISDWKISEKRLTAAEDTDQYTTKLVGSGYEKMAAYLAEEIKAKAKEIRATQGAASTPEDQIAAYSLNVKRLDQINQNIEQLRRMVEAAEKAKKKKTEVKNVAPDVAMTWKLIYATIAFLVVIAISFYFLWWGQIKAKQNQKLEEVTGSGKKG